MLVILSFIKFVVEVKKSENTGLQYLWGFLSIIFLISNVIHTIASAKSYDVFENESKEGLSTYTALCATSTTMTGLLAIGCILAMKFKVQGTLLGIWDFLEPLQVYVACGFLIAIFATNTGCMIAFNATPMN